MSKDWEKSIDETEVAILEEAEDEVILEESLEEAEIEPDVVPIEIEWEPTLESEALGATKSSRKQDSDPTQLYLMEIGASPLLSAEEEIHYARLARKGDEPARNHMVRCNLPPGRQNCASLFKSWLSLIRFS